LVLDRGRVAASGPTAQVLTENTLARVFGVKARVETEENGRVGVSYLED
jgi:iron complex transport system ATP-binding protein